LLEGCSKERIKIRNFLRTLTLIVVVMRDVL
jgi:hypothetical protein